MGSIPGTKGRIRILQHRRAWIGVNRAIGFWGKNRKGSKTGADGSDNFFRFSTISPNSRRHPIIARLDPAKLDISDVYSMPAPSAATPLSTPRQNSTFLEDTMEDELAESNEEYVTDDRLRLIIITTGLWVAFKEGWSPSFKYDDKDTTAQRSPSRTTSFSPLTTPPSSPGPAFTGS